MKTRKQPSVESIDRDIKVAALLTTAAIVAEREEASFFLTALAQSIINTMPKAAQSGAEKLVKEDSTRLLEVLCGSAKPKSRRRRAKA